MAPNRGCEESREKPFGGKVSQPCARQEHLLSQKRSPGFWSMMLCYVTRHIYSRQYKIMLIWVLLILLFTSTLQQSDSLGQRPNIAYFGNPTTTTTSVRTYDSQPSFGSYQSFGSGNPTTTTTTTPTTSTTNSFNGYQPYGSSGSVVTPSSPTGFVPSPEPIVSKPINPRESNPDSFKTLAFSGDGKSAKVIPIQSLGGLSSLPFKIPTAPASRSSSSSNLQKSFVSNANVSPSADLKTIQTNPFPSNPSARAMTPGPQTELNLGIIVIYEITFYNDCPRNPAWMHLYAWDDFIIYDPEAGVQIAPALGTWIKQIQSYILLPSKCGCNKLWVVLYNWQNPSYYAIWYEFIQPQTGCYNCPENNVEGFYNRDTCTCECATVCSCGSWLKIWTPYPFCRCMCVRDLICYPPRYFSKKTCQCECIPLCCLYGQRQDPNTCNCR